MQNGDSVKNLTAINDNLQKYSPTETEAKLQNILPLFPTRHRLNLKNREIEIRHPEYDQYGPIVDHFIKYLHNQIINFCHSNKKLQRTTEGSISQRSAYTIKLFREACRLLQKQKNSGDIGELLLFTILTEILRAPRLLAKMPLKTNPNMPIHGSDGIHILCDPKKKTVTLYFGEAKVYKNLNGAIKSAIDSMNTHINPTIRQHEIQLIENGIHDLTLSDEEESLMLEILDPLAESSITKMDALACVIMFDSKAVEPTTLQKDILNKAIKKAYQNIEEDLQRTQIPESVKIKFFLVPVPSVEDIRDGFSKLLIK